MLELLQKMIGNYYGLDWAVLVFGLLSTVLMTNGNLKTGMQIGLITCACGFSCAMLSGQNGFVVYNLLLMGVNLRGLLRGDRRGIAREVLQAANTNTSEVTPQAAPVRAAAR